MSKVCTKCEIEKNLEEFYKRKESKDGYFPSCKKCKDQLQRKWDNKNAEHLKKCRNNNKKEKRKKFSNVKKLENLTVLLYHCLKNKQKTSKLENYLGCKLNFLYKWLAYTAGEDFDWSQYGKIYEVDHCIPKSFYDHENEYQIKQCWLWKNLRLIKKEENITKGNKLDLDIFYENASLAEDFLELNEF